MPAQWRGLAIRVAILMLVVAVTVVVIHLEGGLIDHETGAPPTFLNSLYFTMVTITTVGYGDIVPVSTFARMVDTFFLTPMRFIFFILFVGIAYQLSLRQIQEAYRMKRVEAKLKGHTIVCGFGETGRVAVQELLAQGIPADQLVVLDTDEAALDEAAKLDVVVIVGDATREKVLESVAIERAWHILICPGRDDTAVLIALTAQDLNPDAKLVVMCHDIENVRLIQRSGAHTIVSQASGYLMAAATRRPHLVATMKDLIEVGGALRLDERRVRSDEVGKHPGKLDHLTVVRVYRDDQHFNVDNFPSLEENDLLIYVAATGAVSG